MVGQGFVRRLIAIGDGAAERMHSQSHYHRPKIGRSTVMTWRRRLAMDFIVNIMLFELLSCYVLFKRVNIGFWILFGRIERRLRNGEW